MMTCHSMMTCHGMMTYHGMMSCHGMMTCHDRMTCHEIATCEGILSCHDMMPCHDVMIWYGMVPPPWDSGGYHSPPGSGTPPQTRHSRAGFAMVDGLGRHNILHYHPTPQSPGWIPGFGGPGRPVRPGGQTFFFFS